MKFKLKFEVIYPGMDKGYVRDAKLENILSDIQTEVISDSPISPPSKNDVVILNDIEYIITGIKHKIEPNLYTIIADVEDMKTKEKIEKEKKEKEMARMLNTFSNFR